MEVNCALCHEPVVFGRSMTIDHRCGCYTHTKCHVGLADARPKCPIHVPDSDAAKNIKSIDEPTSPGPDWVTAPAAQSNVAAVGNAFIKNAWSTLSDINKKNPEDISNPFTLLGMHKPVEWMIRVKKLGLKDMYEQGVRLNHFLENGYTINDLCLYKDIGKLGAERGLMALKKLGLNADLLLDHADKLPLSLMREKFKLTSADICEDGILQFHPEKGLRDDWSLDNLIYLGINFKDLQKYCGLKLRRHWDALEPTQEHMDALKCSTKDISLLLSDTGVSAATIDANEEEQEYDGSAEGEEQEEEDGRRPTGTTPRTTPGMTPGATKHGTNPPFPVLQILKVPSGSVKQGRRLQLLKK